MDLFWPQHPPFNDNWLKFWKNFGLQSNELESFIPYDFLLETFCKYLFLQLNSYFVAFGWRNATDLSTWCCTQWSNTLWQSKKFTFKEEFRCWYNIILWSHKVTLLWASAWRRISYHYRLVMSWITYINRRVNNVHFKSWWIGEY